MQVHINHYLLFLYIILLLFYQVNSIDMADLYFKGGLGIIWPHDYVIS